MPAKTGEDETKDSRVHFNIEAAQQETYRAWARADALGGESKIFDSMASMFVFAAALGFARGARRGLQGRKVDVFRWQNLDDLNQTTLKSLALAATNGEVTVLADRGMVADVVEEYATAGVDILKAELGSVSGDRATEKLARLACEFYADRAGLA